MPQTVFKRQLIGQQSGVQVNMPIDRVERMLPDSGMQTFAAAGRFSRGRIDKPFLVSASQFFRYLGFPSSVRSSALNSTAIQVYDALKNGAAAVVVSRIVHKEARNRWIIVGASNVDVRSLGMVENIQNTEMFGTAWYVAVKMADCINDGVFVSVQKGETMTEVAITIRERSLDSRGQDTANGEILYQFAGSINPEARTENGDSNYIVDIAYRYYGDWLEVVTNTAHKTLFSENLITQRPVQQAMTLFTESNKQPENDDFIKAAEALGKTRLQYRYILSEGSHLPLIVALFNTAWKYNRIIMQEVSGSLKAEAAVRWVESIFDEAQASMYRLWVWSPIKRSDPTGMTGVYQFPTVGQKIGKACARNAIVNAFGLPALNQPIAGKDFYITGQNIVAIHEPDDVELAMLAKARINPVQYVEYHDGSGFVWDDSLSGAKKNGISRLESTVEISQYIQETFGRYARSLINKPMNEALRLMKRFAEEQLQAMQASEWLIPSESLGGKAYQYIIQPSARSPEDEMEVTLNVAINGVVRRIIISENLYSRT